MADVEAALLDWLGDLAYTVTSTPADLEQQLPVIRIRRVGGGGDRDNDRPTISIQTFGKPTSGDPRPAHALAAQVEDKFLTVETYGPQPLGPDLCLDEATKESGPVELTYPNPAVRVTETIFRLVTRR
jgi:hypothetical protein